MLRRMAFAALLAALLCPICASGEPLDLRREAELLWDTTILAFFADDGWGYTQTRKNSSERSYHPQAGWMEGDRDPVDVFLRRTEALLADVQRLGPTKDLSDCARRLEALKAEAAACEPEWGKVTVSLPTKARNDKNAFADVEIRGVVNRDERFPIFEKVYLLQREIALANPLLNFDEILFVKRQPATLSHMCDQYFGIVQVPDPRGGLFVLEDAFTGRPTVRNVLAGARVGNGRLQGQPLTPGSFLSPDLTYDGRWIYFAFTETKQYFAQKESEAVSPPEREKFTWRKGYDWDETRSFHLFRVRPDGSELTMLTDGPVNDFDPVELPNGRIAFISERRGGEGRCHPRKCPTYVLHSMLPDGSDIVPLSYHETNEWHPSVNNEGEIVYSRWDYVDREIGAGQFPWVTKPDGRDARAIFGNYDQARLGGAQFEPKAIPGTTKYTAIICGHHAQSYGPISVFDASVPELLDETRTVVYLTPEQAGGRDTPIYTSYATPWPLHENYFLVAYSPQSAPLGQTLWSQDPYVLPVQHGLYLLDAFGNRILLYRDEEIGSISPMPLRARTRPPVIPHQTAHALPPDQQPTSPAGQAKDASTVSILDVYQSLKPWPDDRPIKRLRIVQLFPKTTPFQDNPPIGHAEMMNARASLGSVPVEADGSAHFTMPAKVPVYFQALDANGLAIQTMMSDIYTHPDEQLSCVGCHEPPFGTSPRTGSLPIAMRRAPSAIEPDATGAEPMNFSRLIQPILQAKCVECHRKHDKAPNLSADRPKGYHPWNQAYINLKPYLWYVGGREKGKDNPRAARARSTPGQVGAHQARLYKLLTAGSHRDRVKLSAEQLERLTVWLDLSSPYLGAYHDWKSQVEGKLVRPGLE